VSAGPCQHAPLALAELERALPFLIGRLDQCWENIPAAAAKTRLKPSHYARQIYADAVVFRQDALEMAVSVFGSDNVMYGSDYPHTIGDAIECLARVDPLGDGVRERVRGMNARRVFGFWTRRCSAGGRHHAELASGSLTSA
jgi:aminocarboxymuconate-semialdehyde decarboxylase